ncbi:MAG: LuxR C-terminal-related transcriptional regulator [Anaerolineales bacterium]
MSTKSKVSTEQASISPELVSTIPSNLPTQAARLIGRYDEMMSLRLLLLREDIQLVTITGFGGAGKTTLSLRVASSLLEQFPSGVFFINLEPLNDHTQILPAILQTLKLREEQNTTPQQTLDDFLSQRVILLVLDNFEHLIDGVALVSNLLEKHVYLKIMVTSREPLRLRREQIFPLDAMSAKDAVELFTQRARALNPKLNLTEEEIKAVSILCEKLDGLPLAIELAAQHTTLFSPQALLARFQSVDLSRVAISDADSAVWAFLTSKTRDLPKRHQTLYQTIAWSYSLLNDHEKHVFRMVSVFQGGFRLEALKPVISMDEALLLDAVSSLVDKNLLKTNLSLAGESRFSMLNTIREFAWAQALRQENINALTENFIGYYLALVRGAEQGFRGNNQVELLNQLDMELANIETALRFALEGGYESSFWKTSCQMLAHLQRYWLLRAHYTVGVSWLEKAKAIIDKQVLISSKTISTDLLYQRSKVYSLLGYLYWITGRYVTANELHEVSLADSYTLNDENLLWETLNNTAVNLEYMGHFEVARTYYFQAVQILQKIGDRWQEMRLLINLGNACVGLGEYERGRDYLENALRITLELRDEYYQAACLHGIGYLELRLRRLREAEDVFFQSLILFERMDVPFIYSWALVSLARVLGETKKHKETAKLILKCVEALEDQKDRNLYRTMFETLIVFCISLGRFETAVIFFGFWEQNYVGEGRIIIPADKAIIDEMIQNIKKEIGQEQYELQNKIGRKENISTLFQLASEICREILSQARSQPKLRNLLTEREADVLRLIVQGKSNIEISTELVVVLKTVEKHVANIFRKLGVKNRTEAAAWALENGVGGG